MYLFLLLNLFRYVFDKMQCLDLHWKRLNAGTCSFCLSPIRNLERIKGGSTELGSPTGDCIKYICGEI